MLISAPILLDHFLETFKRFRISIIDQFTQNMHELTLDRDATPMVVDSVGDGKKTPIPSRHNWIPDQAGAAQTDAVQADVVQTSTIQADVVQTSAIQTDVVQASAVQADVAQVGAAQADADQASADQAGANQPILIQVDLNQNRLYQRRMQRQQKGDQM